MKVVVTGGAGFIGSHIAEHFAAEGWTVAIIDNASRQRLLGSKDENTPDLNWSRLSTLPNVKLHRCSILDKEFVARTARDADAVVHAAAQVAVTSSLQDPRTDFETNAIGTINVLEACRKARTNPKLIVCSTNKVYGENVNTIRIRIEDSHYKFKAASFRQGVPESFPVDHCGHSPYGVSKLTADLYAQEYGSTYGLTTGVFRMSCIYGPGQYGNADQGWLAHFVLSAIRRKPITVFGDGKQVRDVLFIADLVQAYSRFLSSRVKSAVFNMGGGPANTISVNGAIRMISSLVGRKLHPQYRPWRTNDQKVYVSDIRKAVKLLRWSPRVDPRTGLSLLYSWAAGLHSEGRRSAYVPTP